MGFIIVLSATKNIVPNTYHQIKRRVVEKNIFIFVWIINYKIEKYLKIINSSIMDNFEKWILKKLIDDMGILLNSQESSSWVEKMRKEYDSQIHPAKKIKVEAPEKTVQKKKVLKKVVEKNVEQKYTEGKIFPYDILIKIASFLDVKSLVKISEVCRYWYLWSRSDICWNSYINKLLNMEPELKQFFKTPSTKKYVDVLPIKEYNSNDVDRKAFKMPHASGRHWKSFVKNIVSNLDSHTKYGTINPKRNNAPLIKFLISNILGIKSANIKIVEIKNFYEKRLIFRIAKDDKFYEGILNYAEFPLGIKSFECFDENSHLIIHTNCHVAMKNITNKIFYE